MRRMGFWIGALGLVVSAALLAACGGDGEPAAVAQRAEQSNKLSRLRRSKRRSRRLGCR